MDAVDELTFSAVVVIAFGIGVAFGYYLRKPEDMS